MTGRRAARKQDDRPSGATVAESSDPPDTAGGGATPDGSTAGAGTSADGGSGTGGAEPADARPGDPPRGRAGRAATVAPQPRPVPSANAAPPGRPAAPPGRPPAPPAQAGAPSDRPAAPAQPKTSKRATRAAQATTAPAQATTTPAQAGAPGPGPSVPTPAPPPPSPTRPRPTPTPIRPGPPRAGPTPTDVGPTPTDVGPAPTDVGPAPAPAEVGPAPAPAESDPAPTEATPAGGPDRSDPARPHQRGASLRARAPQTTTDQPEATVELEPTTGAPVDAVPRRVPVRQPKRWRRVARAAANGAPDDADPAVWAPIEEVHWDGTPIREEARQPDRETRDGRVRRRRTRAATHPPDPLRGLAVLLALSLLAAFFAWVSAGPLWVAVGHTTSGTVVIGDCTGGGLTQRCRGIFAAEAGRFVAHGVRVSGVPAERTETGTTLPARMTGPHGGTAYVDTGIARHLRWVLGLLAVAGCGAGIARWTGSTMLTGRRARRWAIGISFAGPGLITLGFLIAAW
ncbi:hypothetical protein ABTX15_01100 [Micromonospora sp. NPDC094482]|uniref:hypothetical protein n=1 Tax=unclassified Micromonospora TaxID=2617518 RepID=UPI0033203FE0